MFSSTAPQPSARAFPVKFVTVAVCLTVISFGNALVSHHDRRALRDAVATCADVTLPSALAISACSIVIGRNSNASWAYTNRALAYSSELRQDRAIADLDV